MRPGGLLSVKETNKPRRKAAAAGWLEREGDRGSKAPHHLAHGIGRPHCFRCLRATEPKTQLNEKKKNTFREKERGLERTGLWRRWGAQETSGLDYDKHEAGNTGRSRTYFINLSQPGEDGKVPFERRWKKNRSRVKRWLVTIKD